VFSAGEIADRIEIQHRINLYVHSLDGAELDRMDEVFSDDVVFDYSSIGVAPMSWTAMKEWLRGLPKAAMEQHIYANTLISFSDKGTRAVSLSQVFNPQGMRGPDEVLSFFTSHGVYRDEWEKGPHGWRIRSRAWTSPFYTGDVPQDLPRPVVPGEST
jgi:hypothetical protein